MAADTAAGHLSVLLVHPRGDQTLATTGAYESLNLGSVAAGLRARGHRADVHDVSFEGDGIGGVLRRAELYHLVVAEALYRSMPEIAALAGALGAARHERVSVADLDAMFPSYRVVPRSGDSVPPVGVLGLGVRARPREVMTRVPEIGFVLAEQGRVPHVTPVRDPARVASRGVVDVEATRGCSYTCTFCIVAAREDGRVDRHWVPRPPAEVVAEIHEHVSRTGVRRVSFVDDNLLGAPRAADAWLNELVGELRARRLTIAFSAYLRADVCTPQRVSLLAEAGLVQAHIGVESGSDRVLARLGKATTRAAQAAGVLALRSRDVEVVPSLMTFEPRQNLDELVESLSWIDELGLERGFGPNGLIPLPGALATLELEDAGLLEPPMEPWALPVATIVDNGVRRVARALVRFEERVARHAPGWLDDVVARRFRAEDGMSFLNPGVSNDLEVHDRFRRSELRMCLGLAQELHAGRTTSHEPGD